MAKKTRKKTSKVRMEVRVSTPLDAVSVLARDHAHLSSDEIRFRISTRTEKLAMLSQHIDDADATIDAAKARRALAVEAFNGMQTEIDALNALVEARR